jgi:hypothetical protein
MKLIKRQYSNLVLDLISTQEIDISEIQARLLLVYMPIERVNLLSVESVLLNDNTAWEIVFDTMSQKEALGIKG